VAVADRFPGYSFGKLAEAFHRLGRAVIFFVSPAVLGVEGGDNAFKRCKRFCGPDAGDPSV